MRGMALAPWLAVTLAACAGGSAGAPTPRAVSPRARGEVLVSVLTREGGHWGTSIAWQSPPEALVRPCHAHALAKEPGLTGWALFDVRSRPRGAALAEGSQLPEELLGCMQAALATLRPSDDGLSVPDVLVYVALR